MMSQQREINALKMAVNIILLTNLTLLAKSTYGVESAQLYEENGVKDFYLEPQERIISEVEP